MADEPPWCAAYDDTVTISLDCDSEVWTGHFPGLGTITIAADGSVDVTAEASADEDAQTRQRALRYGWAEGLSLVRRGFMLAAGAAVVHPETAEATILTGDPHDVAVALVELSNRGWLALSDRLTPLRWDDDRLMAHPREAPILLASARAQKCGLSGQAARTDTDALIVDLPRATEPAVVTAAVGVAHRRPFEDVVTNLTGQKRFEAASHLILGGVLGVRQDSAGGTTAAENMAETLRLTSLRFCALRVQTSDIAPDVDSLLRWLEPA